MQTKDFFPPHVLIFSCSLWEDTYVDICIFLSFVMSNNLLSSIPYGDAYLAGIKAVVGGKHPEGEYYDLDNLLISPAASSPTYTQLSEIEYRLWNLLKDSTRYAQLLQKIPEQTLRDDFGAYTNIQTTINVLLKQVELHKLLRDIDSHLYGVEWSADDPVMTVFELGSTLGHDPEDCILPLANVLYHVRTRPEGNIQTSLLMIEKVVGELLYVLGIRRPDDPWKQVGVVPSRSYVTPIADKITPSLIKQSQRWVNHEYPAFEATFNTYFLPWDKTILHLVDMLIEANREHRWDADSFAAEFLAWYLALSMLRHHYARDYFPTDEQYYFDAQTLLYASPNYHPSIAPFITQHNLPKSIASVHAYCRSWIQDHPWARNCPADELQHVIADQHRNQDRDPNVHKTSILACKKLIETFCQDINLYDPPSKKLHKIN